MPSQETNYPTGNIAVIVPPANDFGWALAALRQGYGVTRRGWHEKGGSVRLQTPDLHSKMTLPYLYLRTVDGMFVPWLAAQIDLLARDWTLG